MTYNTKHFHKFRKSRTKALCIRYVRKIKYILKKTACRVFKAIKSVNEPKQAMVNSDMRCQREMITLIGKQSSVTKWRIRRGRWYCPKPEGVVINYPGSKARTYTQKNQNEGCLGRVMEHRHVVLNVGCCYKTLAVDRENCFVKLRDTSFLRSTVSQRTPGTMTVPFVPSAAELPCGPGSTKNAGGAISACQRQPAVHAGDQEWVEICNQELTYAIF